MSIVAIGGGEMAQAETEPLDRHICALVDSETPRALFVPTASGDAEGYCTLFETYYGERLGCETRHLTVLDEDVEREAIQDAVEWADLVYVGGGSLPHLLDHWEPMGVGETLLDAFRNDTVLAGLSAGAMCWFETGLTDAGKTDAYTTVDALGLIPALACTAHATEARREAFRNALRQSEQAGVAIEDGAALELIDGTFRVHTVSGDERVYAYRVVDGELETTTLEGTEQFRDIELLR